jgi:hypothetical protein
MFLYISIIIYFSRQFFPVCLFYRILMSVCLFYRILVSVSLFYRILMSVCFIEYLCLFVCFIEYLCLFVCFIEYLCLFLFYKIVKECNETLAVQLCNHHVQANIKVRIIVSNALVLCTRVVKLYTAEGQHCTVGTYIYMGFMIKKEIDLFHYNCINICPEVIKSVKHKHTNKNRILLCIFLHVQLTVFPLYLYSFVI